MPGPTCDGESCSIDQAITVTPNGTPVLRKSEVAMPPAQQRVPFLRGAPGAGVAAGRMTKPAGEVAPAWWTGTQREWDEVMGPGNTSASYTNYMNNNPNGTTRATNWGYAQYGLDSSGTPSASNDWNTPSTSDASASKENLPGIKSEGPEGFVAKTNTGAGSGAAPASTGLTPQQGALYSSAISAGVQTLGSVLTYLGNNATRDQQAQLQQMQFQLQQGQLDMQRAQAEGNRALQLEIAQMTNARLAESERLAREAGNTTAAQQLQQLSAQNQMLTQQLSAGAATATESGIPTWALVAGTVAFVGLGAAVIYLVATKNQSADAEEDDYPQTLAARRFANKRALCRSST